MIAIDATPLATPEGGGVARALGLLLQGLAELPERPAVHLLAPGALDPAVPELDGVHVPPRPPASPRAFRRRLLPALLERLDAGVLYVPFAAVPRVDRPVVACIHELPHVRWGAIEGWRRRWRFARATDRAARVAAALLVPSRATADDLLHATGVDARRVHVTGNAFDPEPWARTPWGAGGPDVVAVGSGAGAAGARKKGMDVLAGVAAARPDLDFEVVGRPSTRAPPNLTFRGALSDPQLRTLVASARVLVHAARSEGFGYPPLEAMAAGVPVVATRTGSLPEVLGDAACFAQPGDAPSLGAALDRVLDDDTLRQDLRRRGLERAQAYAPAVVARRVLDVLGAVSR